VRPGGYFYAYKGPAGSDELLTALPGLNSLSLEFEDMISYCVGPGGYGECAPDSENNRTLIKFRKTAKLSVQYPRPYTKILKCPIT